MGQRRDAQGRCCRAFDVDLSGLDKVLLLVEEAGDGIMYDHADWLEVKITTRGEVEPLPSGPGRSPRVNIS